NLIGQKILHAADILSRGGDGITSGGHGGAFLFDNRQAGEVRVSGNLDTSGGAAFAGPGGGGGDANVATKGSVVRFAASFDSRGGETVSATANAGNGGFFNMNSRYYDGGTPYTNTPGDDTPAGNLYFGGNVITGGGSVPHNGSGAGGYGGMINIE